MRTCDACDLPNTRVSMISCYTESWKAVQNFQARTDDILIATYPRTGNRWLLPLLEVVVTGTEVADKMLTSPQIIRTHPPVQLVLKSFWEQNSRVIHRGKTKTYSKLHYMFYEDCLKRLCNKILKNRSGHLITSVINGIDFSRKSEKETSFLNTLFPHWSFYFVSYCQTSLRSLIFLCLQLKETNQGRNTVGPPLVLSPAHIRESKHQPCCDQVIRDIVQSSYYPENL
uniref:Sulfotransferase family 1, cytosolic sulfotransferase 9 n=1 Tax=Stegastes partitus TaxID=144197 RepID=A0A3B5A118_9TELE